MRKYKKDINPFVESALEILSRTEIVTFRYKADESNAIHIGIIADDSPMELTGPNHDTFDLNSTCGLLIKAVQEQQKQINELKEKLESMM